MSERENRLMTTLPPEEYHGMKRLSSSGIKQLLKSPAHFRRGAMHRASRLRRCCSERSCT
jgi:hypothetical protein